MATPSAAEQIEALELARSRLEAALSDDENWRALTRAGVDGDAAADSVARRARNTRLEMALADNAHYQDWKRLTGAIDALRAMTAAQGQACGPLVEPSARGPAALPDDVEALLRSEAPGDAAGGVQRGKARPESAASGPAQSAHAGLVDRLERLAEPRDQGERRSQGQARPKDRQAPPVPADPPEATVTFVVRETRAPLLPSAELPPDLGAERSSALLDRLRSLSEVPEPTGATHPPSDTAAEEAEVTIVSADGLRQRREADERAGIVRRFRKALSGD